VNSSIVVESLAVEKSWNQKKHWRFVAGKISGALIGLRYAAFPGEVVGVLEHPDEVESFAVAGPGCDQMQEGDGHNMGVLPVRT